MSENVMDFFYKVTMIFIFICAVSLFLTLYRNSLTTMDIVKENYGNEYAIYQGKYNSEDYYVTGAEIISKIQLGLEKNIKVEKEVFEISDPYSFDYSMINPQGLYHISSKDNIIIYTQR